MKALVLHSLSVSECCQNEHKPISFCSATDSHCYLTSFDLFASTQKYQLLSNSSVSEVSQICSEVHKSFFSFSKGCVSLFFSPLLPTLQGIVLLRPEPCRYTTLHLGEGAAFSEPVQSNPTTLVNSWKATPRRSLFVSCFGHVTTLQLSLPHATLPHSPQSSEPSS